MSVTINGTTGIDAVQSGTVDLTTDVTGVLPNANGGLPTAGTSGNVLTSNGSAWVSSAPPAGGVTSLNGQTGAITNTDYGAIGSYFIGSTNASGTTSYANNATVAGSILVRNSSTTVSAISDYATSGSYTGAGLSGTWRNMGGFSPSGSQAVTSGYYLNTIWVRIS